VAVTRRLVVLTAFLVVVPAVASPQTIATEVDVTVGRSTDGTNGAAIQTRVFGTSRSDWRVFLEAAWGVVSGGASDAFSAPYPYDKRVRPMELYVEKMQRTTSGGAFVAVRAGRYRTPFGISGASDHAYAGFLRAPLIRYDWNWSLSNTFMDLGANVLVGRPSFSIESSLGVPSDESYASRRHGATGVIRAQAYVKSLIVGASYINSPVQDTDPEVTGRLALSGVDARWMHGGVQIRGEWIAGEPDAVSRTHGGYVDVTAHHRAMGRVTFVGRVERLNWHLPPAPQFDAFPRRLTAGALVRVSSDIQVQANVLHGFARAPHAGDLFAAVSPSTAFDLAVTYSRRF
jgi:hypothetical protein